MGTVSEGNKYNANYQSYIVFTEENNCILSNNFPTFTRQLYHLLLIYLTKVETRYLLCCFEQLLDIQDRDHIDGSWHIEMSIYK